MTTIFMFCLGSFFSFFGCIVSYAEDGEEFSIAGPIWILAICIIIGISLDYFKWSCDKLWVTNPRKAIRRLCRLAGFNPTEHDLDELEKELEAGEDAS